ncbi:MAG: acetyltransferase [Desulfotalea sp.]
MNYDVFNGDADGICALHQLRLVKPIQAKLISGVKRDIKLLNRIADITNANITVLDISLDSNKVALCNLLKNKNNITYYDHHFAGEIPANKALHCYIDTSADTCTSLITHKEYPQNPAWAICGSFGDNLHIPATELAQKHDYSEQEVSKLKEIGELLNYNGYGADLNDLHFSPIELYKSVSRFTSPFDFFDQSEELSRLRNGYKEDFKKAMSCQAKIDPSGNRIYFFPDESWARRVAGVFANFRAREKANVAHALITRNSDKTLRISVRAPLENKKNADTLCKSYPTGGGRMAAAGINYLPAEMLDDFLLKLAKTYQG